MIYGIRKKYEIYLKSKSYCSEELVKIVNFIYNNSNVKICALMYELKGNNHDESWVKVYDVFDAGIWSDYLNKEAEVSTSLYEETPIINKNQDFESFDITSWAEPHEGIPTICCSGEEGYRNIYIDYKCSKKMIKISRAWLEKEKYICVEVYS